MLDIQRAVSGRRAAFAWFSRLWAAAAIAHVVGNPRLGQVWPEPTALGVASLVLGLVATLLLLRPESRTLLASVSALVLATAWLEAPVLGNHWLLAALVSVALLAALTRSEPWDWFAPTGRLLLLSFYGFAAFAKLNTGFLDPTVSCALVYTNQGLAAAGLPTIAEGSGAALGLAVATVLVELSIPVLLLVPSTRRWGVLVGVAFHTLVSLDMGQHFYDFTSVLFPLFGLFLPDHALTELETGTRLPGWSRTLLAAVPAVFVAASVAPATPLTVVLLSRAVFALWIPFALWVTWRTVRAKVYAPDVRLEPKGVVGVVLVALALFNGLTPYLEIKTATGWNMYGNLLTAGGESNHLLVRVTYPLTDTNRDPVEVLESDDPGLAAYVGSGYALPERRLRHHLAEHPQATVTFRQAGRVRTATGAELGKRLPLVVEKLQPFRAIDLQRPVRCQTTWLPAL